MITKGSDSLVVEGFVVSPLERSGEALVRQRIEIDAASGLFRSIGKPTNSGDLVLDDQYVILPGLIDIHVHAREDSTSSQSYKESYRSAGEAAIHGGVTALVDMPNNPEPPTDDASYTKKRELARSGCPVDVLLYAGIGPRTRPLSLDVPYKAYMGPSVGDLFFESDEQLRDALARYRGKDVSFHAEAPDILARCKGAPTHGERRPAEAEWKAVETAIQLSESFHIRPHICHLSTAEGLDIIRAARDRGIPVTCEVTPQHLYYDQDNATNFHQPSLLQCNPPVRSRLDRIALLEAFRKGEIEYLATDHAPHSLEENLEGISGMPHLDTYGSFLFWLREEGIPWSTVRLACAERPGGFLSRYLPQTYGKVEKGCVGSLTILQKQSETVRRGSLKTRSGWSPFEGCNFTGRVSHTVVRGKVYPQITE